MKRITIADIEQKLAYLNELTGNPAQPWNESGEPGKRGNIGNYHLSGAYGRWAIHQMSNGSGGVHEPIFYGHEPKRACFELLCAYVRGIESRQYFETH